MKIVADYNTYISNRLKNQGCVTQAERDGIAALESVDEKNRFYLLYIHEDKCSWYGCHKTKSKLRISDFGEDITHDFLNTDELPDGITFAKDSILFLKTEKTSNESQLTDVLKNIFQDVRPMPDSQDIETNGKFCFPKIKLQLSPELSVDLWELVTMKSPFHIFLDKKSLSQKLVKSPDAPTIEKALPNTNHDYTIGEDRVKVLQKFNIYVDGYQNVFLNVTDVNGKCNMTLIYSCVTRHQAPKQAASENIFCASNIPYSLEIDSELHGLLDQVLFNLIKPLRLHLVNIFEDIAKREGKNWLQVFKESFKNPSDKLKNIEREEAKKLEKGSDLKGLIDYVHLSIVFDVHKKYVCRYWGLDNKAYDKLYSNISTIHDNRNDVSHQVEELTISQVLDHALSAMKIAEILKFEDFDFYVDMHHQISEKVKDISLKSNNTQNNNEIKTR